MNFIGTNLQDGDLDLFFGPLENEEFTTIGEKQVMAHLVAAVGVFKSATQARKNGWDKPIPFGFTEIKVGKNKIGITIFNPEG